MKDQKNVEIVKNLLAAKNSMEKTHDFAAKSMSRARAKNPVDKLRVMQLAREIESLRGAKGQARKTAAAKLAKSLVARPKATIKPVAGPVFCRNCGAQLTPGVAFCGNCGARTKA